ncbi:MAG: RagB/SusD family nutrient uptake outer membrane protein [Gemmatimonadetes bacterium]|nr:RagB/SusD family nutrient uptake outer membrane protein [Gemmatimonadota bacterium]
MHSNTMLQRLGRAILGLVLIGGMSACDLDEVLDVSDPSRFTDEALDNPNALPAVANGVEGRLHFLVTGMVVHTGLLSDELMHTGTWSGYEDSDQGRHRPPPGVGFSIVSGGTTGGLAVRTMAQEAVKRFERVQEKFPGTDIGKFMSQATASEGWANLLMAMTECEGVAAPGGEAVTDAQMYEAAITALSNAITVAQGANQTAYLNLARAGRARAYLMTGKFDQALADAQAVPNGFTYSARYQEGSVSNALVTLIHYSENKAAGIDARRWAQIDTSRAGNVDVFIDKWSGMPDPRVPVAHRIVPNRLGVDGRTKYFSHNKYKTRNDDVPMTHWREMRLIEAEVHWRKGDFDQAITTMNQVRADAGLPALAKAGAWTSAEVQERLLEERFATLFLEGQRANDLYRFNLFSTVIGKDFNTKFPMDVIEMLNNSKISQPRSCPAVST